MEYKDEEPAGVIKASSCEYIDALSNPAPADRDGSEQTNDATHSVEHEGGTSINASYTLNAVAQAERDVKMEVLSPGGDPSVVGNSVDLKTLEDRIHERQHRELVDHVETGRDLKLGKARCEPGHFLVWAEEKFDYTPRTTENYRRLVDAADSRPEVISLFKETAIYKLYAPSTSEHLRNEIIDRVKSGEHLTVRAIDEIIRQAKPATDKEHTRLTEEQAKALGAATNQSTITTQPAHRRTMTSDTVSSKPPMSQHNPGRTHVEQDRNSLEPDESEGHLSGPDAAQQAVNIILEWVPEHLLPGLGRSVERSGAHFLEALIERCGTNLLQAS